MKKLKEIIKAGLKDMGNDALRAWGYDTKKKIQSKRYKGLVFNVLKKG